MLPKGGDFGVSFCGHWDDHWVFRLLGVFLGGFAFLLRAFCMAFGWMDMRGQASTWIDTFSHFNPDTPPTMNSWHVTFSRVELVFFFSSQAVTFLSRWHPHHQADLSPSRAETLHLNAHRVMMNKRTLKRKFFEVLIYKLLNYPPRLLKQSHAEQNKTRLSVFRPWKQKRS